MTFSHNKTMLQAYAISAGPLIHPRPQDPIETQINEDKRG